jgi:hypothetical protein
MRELDASRDGQALQSLCAPNLCLCCCLQAVSSESRLLRTFGDLDSLRPHGHW